MFMIHHSQICPLAIYCISIPQSALMCNIDEIAIWILLFDTCCPSQNIPTSFSSLIVSCDDFWGFLGWSSLIYHKRKMEPCAIYAFKQKSFWYILWLPLANHLSHPLVFSGVGKNLIYECLVYFFCIFMHSYLVYGFLDSSLSW